MTASLERFRVHPKIVSETIDGEVIILNLDRGRYYSLTLAGTDAWNAIARAASAAEIVDELMARYEGSRPQMEQAVGRLLGELSLEELIVPVAADAAESPAAVNGAAHTAGAAGARPAFEEPVLRAYTDMEDLLLLDPVHEVDESGWPNRPSQNSQPPR